MWFVRNCSQCGVEFSVDRDTNFCSDKCKSEYWGKNLERVGPSPTIERVQAKFMAKAEEMRNIEIAKQINDETKNMPTHI